MKDFQYKLMDPIGIHARPAGLLVKEAAKFQSDIKLKDYSGFVKKCIVLSIKID